MFYDLPLADLQRYRPAREEPPDFSQFWSTTLQESRAIPVSAEFQQADFGLRLMETYDVEFSGFRGQRVKAWLMLPAGARGGLPCIVEYIGYGGGRSYPVDWLLWSSAGYAHFVMDTRGQGSVWSPGHTPDPAPEGAGPQAPGFLTRGILDPERYYYRRLFTDAVRAVDAVRTHHLVDPRKIIVTGASQGGGVALAVAGLVPDVAAVMPDVPFLCHMRTATEITDAEPYREVAVFCRVHRNDVERVFRTLSYFDGVNLAARAHAPALFSVGLMDQVCPPRTIFAAYNHYAGEKAIRIWPYNGHEGGGTHQSLEKLRFAARQTAGTTTR